MVAFKSLDKAGRTATFTVDGKGDVTRRIPEQFAGTLNDYLLALARGLEVEFAPAVAARDLNESHSFAAGKSRAEVVVLIEAAVAREK